MDLIQGLGVALDEEVMDVVMVVMEEVNLDTEEGNPVMDGVNRLILLTDQVLDVKMELLRFDCTITVPALLTLALSASTQHHSIWLVSRK
jgi:hypothetical protein